MRNWNFFINVCKIQNNHRFYSTYEELKQKEVMKEMRSC